MQTKTLATLLLSGSTLSTALVGQLPQYYVTPAAKPGGTIQTALVGQPGHAFATFLDAGGGPRRFLGVDFYLQLGPALTLFDSGTLGLGGLHVRSIGIPATGIPIGTPVFLQAIVLDGRAPNGLFRASNGESTTLYNSSRVMVEEFTDPVLQGYTGTYDKSVRHRLVGGAVTRRLHTVTPQKGAKFGQPIFGPLNPYGTRIQMVYRAVDLGARGDREVLTALRWLPFGAVGTATFKRLVIDIGHTRIVPDYTVNPISALPQYPNSGLKSAFSLNPKPGEAPLTIVDAAYGIKAADVRKDGYVSYPKPTSDFVYNGFDSMLLDFKMEATPGLKSTTGQQIQLMVLSSPRPDGRVHVTGTSTAWVNPHTATTGRGDNSMTYMQFEFTKVESVATSPWRRAPVALGNFHPPSLAKSEPPGTKVIVEYRGADSPRGSGATMWSPSTNAFDRKAFVQFRVTLIGNPRTGAVPSIESIVVPLN